MNKLEVQAALYKYSLSWEGFAEWSIGLAISKDKKGNTTYLVSDVKRYIRIQLGKSKKLHLREYKNQSI